jgi:hypothetical protein
MLRRPVSDSWQKPDSSKYALTFKGLSLPPALPDISIEHNELIEANGTERCKTKTDGGTRIGVAVKCG